MLTGIYTPGTSWLHRARPGLKLFALLVLTTALIAVATPLAVAVGAVLVLACAASARLGPAVLAAQLRPLRWILVVLVAFQWWAGGWHQVVVIVGGLVVAVTAAGLVTATTTVSAMQDLAVSLSRPLRPLGVDPERTGLLFALAMRAVPVVLEAVREAQAARVARGLARSPRALLVPVVVRTVRHAEHVGEALAARGVDD